MATGARPRPPNPWWLTAATCGAAPHTPGALVNGAHVVGLFGDGLTEMSVALDRSYVC
jgi:hypothetical protein